MELELVGISTLTPDPNNARGHDEGIPELIESLKAFGQRKNLVVWHDVVIAGNGLFEAAKSLKWKQIAISRTPDEWTYEQAQAFALADNRTAELSSWNFPVLTEQRFNLDAQGWNMEAFGFDPLVMFEVDAGNDIDDVPEVQGDAITQPGDLIALGKHRLICGDCRDTNVVNRLMQKREVNLAFTSPPYAEQRKYDEGSGFKPIPPPEYVSWFEAVAFNVASHLATDGSWFVNIKPAAAELDTELYVFDLVLAHVREWGWHFATEYCWERNGVPKSVSRRFKNQFEPIYQFVRNDWKMRPEAVRHESNDVPIAFGKGAGNTSWKDAQGGKGSLFGGENMAKNQGKTRRQKNPSRGSAEDEDKQGQRPWDPGEFIGPGLAYPGNRLPTFTSSHEALGHTAAFPVGLPEFFVNAYTDVGDVVYDPFMGSGSTLIAAERTQRVGLGCELSPKYCDVIVKRWENLTGKKAKVLKTR